MNGVRVEHEVEQFIRQNFFYEGPPLEPEESLMDSGVLDSTGVLEMVAFLEDTFAIKVEDRDLVPENLDSLARIAAYVTRKAEQVRA